MTTTTTADSTRDRSVRAAVAVSGVRCVLVYVLIPLLGPVIGRTGGAGRPLVVALHVLGAALAGRAMWRAHRAGSPRALLLSAALASLNLLGLTT